MKKAKTKIWLYPLMFMGFVALILAGCDKDDSGKLPTVTTKSVTEVTHNSAISGGTITDDGGSIITAIGVCWSQNENPTVSDFYTSDGTYTLDGVELRDFTSHVRDLEPLSRYYLRAYAANEAGVAYGEQISFETDEAGQIIHPLTIDMIDAWTQETSEGPKESLIDGNTGTYWHSAWSSNVEPLPHWIQIIFPEETNIGGFNYTFRQPSGITDRPNHWDIQTSSDGENWETRWTSPSDLPVEPVDEMQTLEFGENFSSRYFRIRILDTYGSRDWTHLSTIEVFENRE
ncbi:MAG: discoidin domain-containing protein [Bacteroidetes bacterium]|nr:MAG: discoidin domain-containing protein [Bacteroidota bacterium]